MTFETCKLKHVPHVNWNMQIETITLGILMFLLPVCTVINVSREIRFCNTHRHIMSELHSRPSAMHSIHSLCTSPSDQPIYSQAQTQSHGLAKSLRGHTFDIKLSCHHFWLPSLQFMWTNMRTCTYIWRVRGPHEMTMTMFQTKMFAFVRTHPCAHA